MKHKDIGDKIDALLRIADQLSENDLGWVEDIDETASEFEYISYTPRQYEVIDKIYQRYFKPKIEKSKSNSIVVNIKFLGRNYRLRIILDEDESAINNCVIEEIALIDLTANKISPEDSFDESFVVITELSKYNPDLLRMSKVTREAYFFKTALESAERYLSQDDPKFPAQGGAVLSAALRALGRPREALDRTERYTKFQDTSALHASRAAAYCDLAEEDEQDNIQSNYWAKAKKEAGRSWAKVKSEECSLVYKRIKKSAPHLF